MPPLSPRLGRRPPDHAARLAAADPVVRAMPLAERLSHLHLEAFVVERFLRHTSREGTASLMDPTAGGLVRALQMDGVDAIDAQAASTSVRFYATVGDLDAAHVDLRMDLLGGAVYVFDFDVTATRSDVLYPQSYTLEVLASASTGATVLARTEGLTSSAGRLLASYASPEDRSYVLVRLYGVSPTVTYWTFRSCVVTRSAV